MKRIHIFIALAVLAVDQLTKLMIRLFVETRIDITRFLAITYAKNTGAGFSILTGNNILLAILSIVIIGVIIYYFPRFSGREQIFAAIIIGGASGNVVDRILLGHVVDFIYLSFWPTFNIADSAIVIGAIGMIYLSFRN